MIMRLTIVFLFLIVGQFALQAQDKPLKRHSKKELIAMVEAQQAKLDALTLQLSSQREALEESRLASATCKARLVEATAALASANYQVDTTQRNYKDLLLKYTKLKNEPPKEVEVLDLYSFGYQPYQYNNSQYKRHLSAAREEVIKARLENIYDLVRVLQSHKITDEAKTSLYHGFKRAYKGYFDRITKNQLTYFNEKVDETLQKGLRQRTFRELDIISKENRWIQMLEYY